MSTGTITINDLDDGNLDIVANFGDEGLRHNSGAHILTVRCLGFIKDQGADTFVELLDEAAQTFRRYEAIHRAKGTPEAEEKAKANAALAAKIEAALEVGE